MFSENLSTVIYSDRSCKKTVLNYANDVIFLGFYACLKSKILDMIMHNEINCIKHKLEVNEAILNYSVILKTFRKLALQRILLEKHKILILTMIWNTLDASCFAKICQR